MLEDKDNIDEATEEFVDVSVELGYIDVESEESTVYVHIDGESEEVIEDIEEKIQNIGGSTGAGSSSGGGTERDQYFEEAGKFIIEKDKASIGMERAGSAVSASAGISMEQLDQDACLQLFKEFTDLDIHLN